jgi:TRAP-type uncharacterized transport system, fused permease components
MAPITPTTSPQVKGLLSRFLTAPDRHPKLRYVYDISLIAISILCIVSIILWTQGSGLALFAIAPALAIGALGVTLLVSDLAESPKSKEVADTVAAVSLPFILTGTAAGLMFSAIAVGGGALILANPLFLMGSMTLGFALMSLHKVTYQYLSNRSQWQKQNKIKQIEFAARGNQLPKESKRGSLQAGIRHSSSITRKNKTRHHKCETINKGLPVSTTSIATERGALRSEEVLYPQSSLSQKAPVSNTPNIKKESVDTESISHISLNNRRLSGNSSDDVYYTAQSDLSSAENSALGDISGISSSSLSSKTSTLKTKRRVVRSSRSERNARHHHNREDRSQHQAESSDDEDPSLQSRKKQKKSRTNGVYDS